MTAGNTIPILPGDVFGKYKLIRSLGEGSFATVFEGLDTTTGSGVALKFLSKVGLSSSQLDLQAKELLLMQELGAHKHIVRLFDALSTPSHLILVLEKCSTDLFDAIMSHSGFEERIALKLFVQLSCAVAHAHSREVYHRDLKPENVLISSPSGSLKNTDELLIKLSDFGLATKDTLSTEFGCGSVRYMAPETLASGSKDSSRTLPLPYSPAANDVWSLGIILINLLTGKNPWVEPSPSDKHFQVHMIRKPRFGSPDSFQTQFGFSTEFCGFLRRIFDLDPFARPSADELPELVAQIPFVWEKDRIKNVMSITPPKEDPIHIRPTHYASPASSYQLDTPQSAHSSRNGSCFVYDENIPKTNMQTAMLLDQQDEEYLFDIETGIMTIPQTFVSPVAGPRRRVHPHAHPYHPVSPMSTIPAHTNPYVANSWKQQQPSSPLSATGAGILEGPKPTSLYLTEPNPAVVPVSKKQKRVRRQRKTTEEMFGHLTIV